MKDPWVRVALLLALLCPLAACTAEVASAQSSSSGSNGAGKYRAAPVARSAAAGDSAPITFDEFDEGTWITDEYSDRGVVFTSDVFTAHDDASPTSPVLSGDPKFFGDIVGKFTVPGTSTPTTVDGFSFDVGYINDRNSVEIEYYDAAGSVVGSTRAQSYGVNSITVAYRGVAGFKVSAVDYEAAGFAIDNLVVRRGSEGTRPLRMAALGDSYSSGEGLLPENGLRYDCGTDLHEGRYYENTNVRWPALWLGRNSCDTQTGSTTMPRNVLRRRAVKYENLCHRHGRAYPNQIRERLGISAQDGLFAACSGATTANIGALAQTEMQYRDSPVGVHGGKTQLANLVDFQASRGAPDLITIGVGGNDANFGGIIAECILGSCATGDFAERTISTINGSMFRNVRDTLVKLRAGFPAATIVSFGYPSVVDDPAADCVGVTRIGEDERAWIKGKVLSAVNDAVKDAATEAGVVYADITRTTAGHGLCSPDPWINGARFGDDKYIFVANESFHPNQKAHDAIAAYFMEHYTDGANRLLATNPEPSAPIRPGTGPEIRLGQVSAWAVQGCGASCLQPAACIQGCPIHLEGSDFTPGAPMHVVLQGGSPSGLSARASQQPVLVDLGQVTANPAGHVVADLRLPRSVSPGVYSLVLEGTSADGTRQHAVVFVRVYGRLASRITATFGVSRRGTRIRTLRARSLPAGSRVDIACARGAADVARALSGLRVTRRGGCPFTRRTFRVTRAATMRSFAHHFRAWLAPGTVVRVMVTHPDNGGRALDVTVRGRRTPRVSARCSQPGQLVPGPC